MPERLPPDSRSAEAQGAGGGHRPRDHQLAGGRGHRGQARAFPVDEGGSLLLPSVVHYATDGAVIVGGRAGPGPGRGGAHQHHRLGEALHGQGPGRRGDAGPWAPTASRPAARWCGSRWRAAPGDADRGLGGDPPRAQAPGGGRASPARWSRRSSPCPPTSTTPSARPPGRRAAGRARGAAAPERAHRRGARLRPGQGQPGDVRGLRPRRRHLRHLHPQAGGGRVRGEVHRRRLRARRRRLRPGHRARGSSRRTGVPRPATRPRSPSCSPPRGRPKETLTESASEPSCRRWGRRFSVGRAETGKLDRAPRSSGPASPADGR